MNVVFINTNKITGETHATICQSDVVEEFRKFLKPISIFLTEYEFDTEIVLDNLILSSIQTTGYGFSIHNFQIVFENCVLDSKRTYAVGYCSFKECIWM